MKITGYGSIDAPNNAGKRTSAAPSGAFANLLSAAEASEASSAGVASEVATVGAFGNLLALQEVTEEEVRRKKLVQRGYSLLESLDQLRRRLLIGSVSPQLLMDISRHIATQKQQVTDPRIMEIIEDIELRAAVELAKIQRALEEQTSA